MIDIKDKKDCCGCGACVQRCPKKCISIIEDHEGFLYPIVDKSRCVDCSLCNNVCPCINNGNLGIPVKVYAAKHKNGKIREESSSGGVFTFLAEYVIEKGGVVFGARFDDNFDVMHDFVDKVDDLSFFRGSKYVQSRIGSAYIKAEQFLRAGKMILFSGTPCQIRGLKLFLKKEYANLLTVDFICHGVPSPEVWRRYKQELLSNYQKNGNLPSIAKISFRDKSLGWKRFCFSVDLLINNQREISLQEPMDKNIFLRGFLSNLYLRPSCYKCPTKSLKSGSDIMIADFWGIQEIHPEIDDNKGISMLMINNDKYIDILNDDSLDLIEVGKQYRKQHSLTRSALKPWQRELFFLRYKKVSLKKNVTELLLINWSNYYILKNILFGALVKSLRWLGIWEIMRRPKK